MSSTEDENVGTGSDEGTSGTGELGDGGAQPADDAELDSPDPA